VSAIITSVVQRHYWFGTRTSGVVTVDDEDVPDYGDRAAFFERAVNRNVSVKIRDLTKVLTTVYRMGEGEAVKLPGIREHERKVNRRRGW